MWMIVGIIICAGAVFAWRQYILHHSALSIPKKRTLRLCRKYMTVRLKYRTRPAAICTHPDQWGPEESPIERLRRSNEFLTQENNDLLAQNERLKSSVAALELSVDKYKKETNSIAVRASAFNALAADYEKAKDEIDYLKRKAYDTSVNSWKNDI